MSYLGLYYAKLAQNGTNMRLFKISFQFVLDRRVSEKVLHLFVPFCNNLIQLCLSLHIAAFDVIFDAESVIIYYYFHFMDITDEFI